MAIPRVLCRVRLLLNNEFSVVSKYATLVNSVQINQCVFQRTTIKQCRINFSTSVVLARAVSLKDYHEQKRQSSSSSSSSSSDSESSDDEEDVAIEYHRGLPQITVPLPSRKERCRFTLKPISHTLGDFIEMMKKEDKGIDRVVCKSHDGTRIASSTTIENLLEEDFKLVINDNSYNVSAPKQERLTSEEVKKLGDIKTLVSELYEALHVKEHQLQKEIELHTQIEQIQQELLPLEEKRNEIEMVAHKKTNWLAWAGLGLMSIQFGILARLTWWEYSWDIMEPVTYFVTYGTAMAAYAYFVLTREEYILADVRDRQHVLTLHKKAKKAGFDLAKYNQLKDQMLKLERQLRKLKNPLRLPVPGKTPPVVVAEPEQQQPPDAKPQADQVVQQVSNVMQKIQKY